MASPGRQTQAPSKFDPFAAGPGRYISSKSWLWATAFQALLTAGLLGLAYLAEGRPWERHAHVIMLIGIVATWSLALRTIRARLVELIRHWQRYSQGLMKRCSESGKHLFAEPLSDAHERYIKGTIWRLRIIAAGLTLPFFVMPMLCSFVAAAFWFRLASANARDNWALVALATMLSAFIVAGYFHWVIMAVPAPLRVSGQSRRYFPQRARRR